MIIRYTETALSEIAELLSYLAHRDPRAAARVAKAIESTVTHLRNHPLSRRIAYENDVRTALVMGFHRYRIYYALVGEELIIRNLRHTARREPWE